MNNPVSEITAKLREGEATWSRTGTSANPTSPNQPNQNRIQCKSQAKLLWAVTCCDCTLKLGTPKLPHRKFICQSPSFPWFSMGFLKLVSMGCSGLFRATSGGLFHAVRANELAFHVEPRILGKHGKPIGFWPANIYQNGGFHKWRYHKMDGFSHGTSYWVGCLMIFRGLHVTVGCCVWLCIMNTWLGWRLMMRHLWSQSHTTPNY